MYSAPLILLRVVKDGVPDGSLKRHHHRMMMRDDDGILTNFEPVMLLCVVLTFHLVN